MKISREETEKVWKAVWENYAAASDLKSGEVTETDLIQIMGETRSKVRAKISRLIQKGIVTVRKGALHNGRRCTAFLVDLDKIKSNANNQDK